MCQAYNQQFSYNSYVHTYFTLVYIIRLLDRLTFTDPIDFQSVQAVDDRESETQLQVDAN